MKTLTWLSCGWLALAGCACDIEQSRPAEMVSMNHSQPVANEKALSADIRFGIGSLEVGSEKAAALYSIDLEYDKSTYQPEVHYEPSGEEGRLSFNLESLGKTGLKTHPHGNRLRLNFSKTVPLKLNLNTGVGDTRLSFTGIPVSRLELESGVGSAKLTCYEPNPVACELVRIKNGVGSMDAVGLGNLDFRAIDFEGGVGGATLDFTGDWKRDAEIKVQVGVGGVMLRMPRTIGVRVDAPEKNFLSGFHLDGFSKRADHYFSENYEQVKVRVTIRVVTGIGGFKVTWI